MSVLGSRLWPLVMSIDSGILRTSRAPDLGLDRSVGRPLLRINPTIRKPSWSISASDRTPETLIKEYKAASRGLLARVTAPVFGQISLNYWGRARLSYPRYPSIYSLNIQ